VLGSGRIPDRSCVEVVSIKLAKSVSLILPSDNSQTLNSELSGTSVLVSLDLELGRGSWSGCPCSGWTLPPDRLLERVTLSVLGTTALLYALFGGIYL
jgi:hypothetical protein